MIYFESEFRYLSKPGVLLSLLFFYWSSVSKLLIPAFLAGLIFAWLGDIILLAADDTAFMAGLISFLVMQILYIIVFLKARGTWKSRHFLMACLLIIYAVMFNYILWPFSDSMKIPIIIYSVAIAAMVMTAALRKSNYSSYLHIVIGAVFFMISDSLLAFDKFAISIPMAGIWIMGSYAIAQYLIVNGMIHAVSKA